MLKKIERTASQPVYTFSQEHQLGNPYNASSKVLIVDDEPFIVEEAIDFLNHEGFATSFANDAETAIELVSSDPDINVVVTDIRMPGMDGLQLASHLKETIGNSRDLVIIVLTGHAGMEEAVKALRLGAEDFLLKPITPDLFLHSIRRAEELIKLRHRERDFKQQLKREVETKTEWLTSLLNEKELLFQTVEQSPTIMFITDTEGNIEFANHKFYEATGFATEEVIGQNARILKSGNTPQAIYEELWRTIKAGNIWSGEIEDRCKNGSVFWADVTITPIRSKDGVVTNYSASHLNITKRKLAEIKMNEAREQAVIANRAKSDLMANMSHELRTPLNAIIGFSDAIKQETFGPLDNEKYRAYLNDIHNSGQLLLDLINDILDVSAIEAGAMELKEEELCLMDLVESSIRIITPRANAGNVEVVSSIDASSPHIFADGRRVKQILLNLLSNAVKFTSGEGEVSINSQINKDKSLSICVADTGIGMDDEDIQKALSKFGQIDSGLDRKHEGAGLGLPLTVGLMERHGGSLEVKSKKKQGTTITITFPKERVIGD